MYRGHGKSAKWDGMVYVDHGKIVNARTYAFDRIDQGIIMKSDKYVKFTSSTSGDYDGLILELESDENTVIRFSNLQGSASAPLKDIMTKGKVFDMGGLNLKLGMTAAIEEIPMEDYGNHLYHDESIPLL